jgi:hypothetical protein
LLHDFVPGPLEPDGRGENRDLDGTESISYNEYIEIRQAHDEQDDILDHVESTQQVRERFLELAECIRKIRQIRCNCKEPNWDERPEIFDDGKVEIQHFCASCHLTATSIFTLAELKEILLHSECDL